MSDCKQHLDIDDSGQFLHSVDENVPLFDCCLVLGVLGVWPGGDDDPTDLVDLAVQPAVGDELGQLPEKINHIEVRRVFPIHEP